MTGAVVPPGGEPSDDVLRGLLAAAPDALLVVDAVGGIVFVSDQAERLFDWRRSDLLGRPVEVLVPEHAARRHVAHRARFLAEPSSRPMGADLQLTARRRDGTTFPAEISLSAVVDADGAITTLAAVRDVTERVEMEAERQRQALQAQRERAHRLESVGQLAGGVAHDFNNLLGVILNYATLLRRRAAEPAVAEDLGQIVAAAERATMLTRQLLAFARRDVAHPVPIDANQVIREFAPLLERTLGEHVELRFDLAPEELVVLADAHQLEQVVLNLTLNGRDAMPHGGTLTVTTSRPAGAGAPTVRLEVADSGVGMTSDVVARAFEPFFTTKPLGEGTGLGLATVFGIVHQNGGEVTITSTPGTGTRVVVDLPVHEGDGPAARDEHRRARGGVERLLLVEDEDALRVATARILSEHGYEVLTATDGTEALDVLERLDGDVAVVLSDVAMPRMRGDQLAVEIAARFPALPVVFMSGYDSEGAVVGRLLEKPVAETALLAAVREAIDGPA